MFLQNAIRLVVLCSFALSIYYLNTKLLLSLTLLSASVFFYFLSLNTKLLKSSTIDELDENLQNSVGKTYLWGSFIIFFVNLIALKL